MEPGKAANTTHSLSALEILVGNGQLSFGFPIKTGNWVGTWATSICSASQAVSAFRACLLAPGQRHWTIAGHGSNLVEWL